MTCSPTLADRPRIAVVTIVSGEHEQLLSHVDGLTLSTWPPEAHVVVSVRDRALTRGRLPIRCDRWVTEVPVLAGGRRTTFLPALRLASQRAIQHCPDVLLYLSVDCIPAPRLLQSLAEEAQGRQGARPTLWYPTVSTLTPPPWPGYPVRDLDALVTDDPGDTPVASPQDDAPWAQAFAMTVTDWEALWPRVESVCPPTSTVSTIGEGLATAGAELRPAEGALVYRQHPPVTGTGTLTDTA